MKRQRPPAIKKPAAKPREPRPLLSESHSGQGSASALEALQKLERKRVASRPQDPGKDDER